MENSRQGKDCENSHSRSIDEGIEDSESIVRSNAVTLESTEEQSLEISPARAYVQMAVIFSCLYFGNLPYFMLYSLQTSVSGELGSVTTGVSLILWAIGLILSSSIVSLLGLKVTLVLSQWLLTAHILAFLYPSWYTLLPGGIISGVAIGPEVCVGSIYINIIAYSLARTKGKHPEHYISILQGVLSSGSLSFASLSGNGLSSLIISLSEPETISQVAVVVNTTTNYINLSVDNVKDQVCQSESTTQPISDQTYYILISVAILSSLVGNFSSFGVLSIPGRTFTCFSLSDVWMHTKSSFAAVSKTFSSLKYTLVLMVSCFCGLEKFFMFSIFSKVICITDIWHCAYMHTYTQFFHITHIHTLNE